jgi:hypothetical protein
MMFFKKIVHSWHLAGFLPLAFGLVCYAFYISEHSNFWRFLWLCPLIAVVGGIAVLLRSHFGMSAAIVWISMGPLLAVLFELDKCFKFWQLHHIFSVVILFLILYKLKDIWDKKGFLFGVTSFYSYIIITSKLSNGEVNLLIQVVKINNFIFGLGILFFILSALIILWHYYDKKINKKINKKNYAEKRFYNN